ncbi:ATP-dependent Zn protease, partial [Aeromonas salmonicida]|nr:ATP-dependent Zn protease [Aeromonas salmonicida]
MTLLSLLSLGGCVSVDKAPPVPTLTLAELRTEINLSEQRLQTSMEQQQKQYVQQQHLLVQLNTDVNNMKESVKKVDSKLEALPPEPPKPMAIPT